MVERPPGAREARRGRGVLLALLAAWSAAGCGDGGDAGPASPFPPGTEPDRPAFSWVGIYEGSGSGSAAGETFEVASTEMRIAFDADSVKLLDCPLCVTIEFDPWFARANVELSAPTEVTVAYTRGDTLRTLGLRLFSGGGGTANVLTAAVRLERASASGADTLLTADFLLARR